MGRKSPCSVSTEAVIVLIQVFKLDFVQDKKTKAPFPPSRGLAFALHTTGLKTEHRISLMPGSGGIDGSSGDHIIISPPYTITNDDVDFIVEATKGVISEVLG